MKILGPLYDVVTFLLLSLHSVFSSVGLDAGGGWVWALSIVALVVAARICLIPLFVRQIKAQRRLQELGPEIRRIQAKFEGETDHDSRRQQQHEMMKLFKDTGTNPLSSFLPILAQAPIFFALFVVLNGIGKHPPVAYGVLTQAQAERAAQAEVLGASIAERFLGAASFQSLTVSAALIVMMGWTTFLTQKQLVTTDAPAAEASNPFRQQQKVAMYVLPAIVMVAGLSFPIGILLYALTSNVWTVAQQFHVIGRMPGPGPARG